MTVKFSLNSEQIKRIHSAAQSRGLDDNTFLSELMDKALEDYALPATQAKKRVLGLKAAGVEWIADDFDAPLPDSFWFGSE